MLSTDRLLNHGVQVWQAAAAINGQQDPISQCLRDLFLRRLLANIQEQCHCQEKEVMMDDIYSS